MENSGYVGAIVSQPYSFANNLHAQKKFRICFRQHTDRQGQKFHKMAYTSRLYVHILSDFATYSHYWHVVTFIAMTWKQWHTQCQT